MLGLGAGGGVRQILADNTVDLLVCVDNNQKSIQECKNIYNMHFPNLIFDIIYSDALDYLKTEEKLFDWIWIDLFTEIGHSELLYDVIFWENISRKSKLNSYISINICTIPTYMNYYSNDLYKITSLCDKFYKNIKLLPNKRTVH